MRTWKAKQLDRGTGCTCPHPDCKAKCIVNMDAIVARRLADADGRTVFPRPQKTMCCPTCYRVALLPKPVRAKLGVVEDV